MLKMLDLFSGIGGFSLAASWTGAIETIAFCEIEPFCQKVLKKHWPDVPIFSDIKELRGDDVGTVDILTGGFPCQPFSCAGKQRGKADDRYLWPEMVRIIQETKPTWIISENVVGLVNLALEDCFLDLEGEGYEVQTFIIPACSLDFPHRRNRVWIVAYSQSMGQHKNYIYSPIEPTKQIWERNKFSQSLFTQKIQEAPNPRNNRDNDGLSLGVHRLKGLGNAIVPQVAYQILQGIVDIENLRRQQL